MNMVRLYLSHCLILLIVTVIGCKAGSVRPPAVAGAFYESFPPALDRQVENLLTKAVRPATTGLLVAAVSPHAGFVFSGSCAVSIYSLLSSGQYDRVIIMCPAHHVFVKGVSLPDPLLTAYSTPLGTVPIDREVCNALRDKPGFVTLPAAAVQEHAIEVQLPFLQKTLQSFRLVPLICGPEGQVDLGAVSAALVPCFGSNTLVIASSDFTHYGENYGFKPFVANIPERLQVWLKQSSERVAALDLKGFSAHCETTHDTICGEMPIKILVATLIGSGRNLSGQVLSQATSGELTGNFENSVSYAAIGFFSGNTVAAGLNQNRAGYKEGHIVKEHRSGGWTPGLTEAEKGTLFAIANDTLKWCVAGRHGKFDFTKYAITPLLKVEMATFVTLKIHGDLRGCIGSLAPVEPLYQSVHNNAVNAALRDPRFNPVEDRELPLIEVDVSVLSPIRDIPSIADFKIGQQGIILAKGRYRAVYLPEVATEQGWTMEETLASLSQKAGLRPDAWREGATFQVFESVVLSEK
ncbi:MAG: AmmeMemoRadiSam system protein B [bacterium]|jgi:AmmeMemoRadiSam system protein B/AmmeMemoRadiSam system protein A